MLSSSEVIVIVAKGGAFGFVGYQASACRDADPAEKCAQYS